MLVKLVDTAFQHSKCCHFDAAQPKTQHRTGTIVRHMFTVTKLQKFECQLFSGYENANCKLQVANCRLPWEAMIGAHARRYC